MDLGFFAADTLGLTLYQINGGLKGREIRQLRYGPWKLDLPVEVESDILGPVELSFWLTLGKKARFYVIIKEKENWLFVLNEEKLKVCGKKTGFAATTVKNRVTEIRPAIQVVFRWKAGVWERVNYRNENL